MPLEHYFSLNDTLAIELDQPGFVNLLEVQVCYELPGERAPPEPQKRRIQRIGPCIVRRTGVFQTAAPLVQVDPQEKVGE